MSAIKPRVPVITVHVDDGDYEKATFTFLELMLQAAENEAYGREREEPPVTRSSALEYHAEFLEDDAAISRLYSVCKRINFDHEDDEERELKKANLKLLVMSWRQHKKKRLAEEENLKKRKRDTEKQPIKITRRTTATKPYSKKMRLL